MTSNTSGKNSGPAQTASKKTWEKSVELALAKWFTLLPLYEASKKTGGLTAEDLAKELNRNNYVPLSGNMERDIGDALAKFNDDRFCVIECKGQLLKGEWDREALPGKTDGDNIQNNSSEHCEGGKDRLATFVKLKNRPAFAHAAKCHFLIGYAKSERDIRYLEYWDYIENGKTWNQNTFRSRFKPIASDIGVPFNEMLEYLRALIESPGKDSEKTDLRFISYTASDQTWTSRATTLDKLTEAFEASELNAQLSKKLAPGKARPAPERQVQSDKTTRVKRNGTKM